MADFQRTVPHSVSELMEYLTKLHDNRGHVKSVSVSVTTGHLEVDLDWAANLKFPDVYMPIKKGKAEMAKHLIENLMSKSKQGYAPSQSDATALFDLIDPQGR
jgi:hypothetical protein